MMPTSKSLQGQHAVVTGGSRGIGLAIAKALLGAGANVSLIARDEKRLEHANDLLSKQYNSSIHIAAADVGNLPQVTAAFEKLKKAGGPISILVNNAGAAESAPLLKTDEALWNRTIANNLTSVYLCTQAVLEHMLEKKYGRIISIASTAGLTGTPYIAAYCAAKHGVVGLTRALALEVIKSGITVNAVCPGYTNTDLLKNAVVTVAQKTGRSQEQVKETYLANLPQGRFVEPDEVASAALWLCLPEQKSITGQTITISGGETLR